MAKIPVIVKRALIELILCGGFLGFFRFFFGLLGSINA